MNTIVYEETLTGRPHDTYQYKKLPVTMKCGCSLTSCPGHTSKGTNWAFCRNLRLFYIDQGAFEVWHDDPIRQSVRCSKYRPPRIMPLPNITLGAAEFYFQRCAPYLFRLATWPERRLYFLKPRLNRLTKQYSIVNNRSWCLKFFLFSLLIIVVNSWQNKICNYYGFKHLHNSARKIQRAAEFVRRLQ